MTAVCKERRQFFRKISGMVALGSTASLFGKTAHASINNEQAFKSLAFYNRHTGETVSGVFSANNIDQEDMLGLFDKNLRDHRQNEILTMDRKLYHMLHEIQQHLATDKPIHIISGFRSEKTNAMLANRSNGVAKKSFHMQGKAIDFAIPGIELSRVRDAAKALKMGGVGYYPHSGFIHIDTAWVRSWNGR